MINHNATYTGQLIRKLSTPRINNLVLRHAGYVEGLENIPRSGPLILVANHSSYMDHFVIKTLTESVRPGRVWFPTKAEAFDTFLSRVWHESMDCYPVNRNAPSEEIFQRAGEVLQNGNTLVLYPEGTRNTESGLLPFKSGAFRIALSNKTPVIPIGMTGLAEILPKGATLPRRRLFSVSIGKPLAVPRLGDERTQARAMRDDAFDEIAALKDRSTNVTVEDSGQALGRMVNLSHKMVAENLTSDGQLPPEVVNRIQLLLRIADKTSRLRLDLQVQQTRMRGFHSLNSLTSVGMMIRAALVNRKAGRLSDMHSSDDFAAYLAGRSSLILPSWMGGGTTKASVHFKRAIDRKGPITSQAYIGLAESFSAIGDFSSAIDAYELALHTIDPADPRRMVRKAKISSAIDDLTSATQRGL